MEKMMNSRTHRDLLADEISWHTSETGTRTVRISMDERNSASPKMVIAHFPAHFRYTAHTHSCNYIEYIVKGHMTVGKTSYGPGDIRVVKAGGGYGPLSTGDEGCTAVVFFERGDDIEPIVLPRRME